MNRRWLKFEGEASGVGLIELWINLIQLGKRRRFGRAEAGERVQPRFGAVGSVKRSAFSEMSASEV